MMVFWQIMGSVIFVSLLSFVGALTLVFKKGLLDRLLFPLVSFAAGAMLGAAFFDLLPEAVALSPGGKDGFGFALLGIVVFFIVEQLFFFYHCHNGKCDHHKNSALPYLNLIGDGIHNFIDGIIIAASYIADVKLGIITTIAVVLHEIPQEFGDFGVLVYGGFKPARALFWNFISALAALLGAAIAFFASTRLEGAQAYLIPFAAGGFIYIAAVDLLPELHHERTIHKVFRQTALFLLGIGLIWLLTTFVKA